MTSVLIDVPKHEAPDRPSEAAYRASVRRFGLSTTYTTTLEDNCLTLTWRVTDIHHFPWRRIEVRPVWPFRLEGATPAYLVLLFDHRDRQIAQAEIGLTAKVARALRKTDSLNSIDIAPLEMEPPPPGSFLAMGFNTAPWSNC